MYVSKFDPCNIVTPENIIWNFAHMITSAKLPAMQILVSIGTVGASPQIGEISPPLWLSWLSCLYLFLDPTPRLNRSTDFHAFGSDDVFLHKDGPFGG